MRALEEKFKEYCKDQNCYQCNLKDLCDTRHPFDSEAFVLFVQEAYETREAKIEQAIDELTFISQGEKLVCLPPEKLKQKLFGESQ